MTPGFSGEVAEYYAKYRPGYPPPVIEALRVVFALDIEDIVLDLGCGTGQLALLSPPGSVPSSGWTRNRTCCGSRGNQPRDRVCAT